MQRIIAFFTSIFLAIASFLGLPCTTTTAQATSTACPSTARSIGPR